MSDRWLADVTIGTANVGGRISRYLQMAFESARYDAAFAAEATRKCGGV